MLQEQSKKQKLFTLLMKEDNGVFSWIEDWFVEPHYVTDFNGTVEETTPAEAYWKQVMPQIKEIIINAYNKGVEDGKAECL